MGNRVFTGLIAGLVSAVLYLTVGTGTLFALLLFYLAPLPLFIAGLGWGTIATIIGSGLGGLLVTAIGGAETGLLFIVTVCLPVIVLTYLILLNRIVVDNGTESIAWFPSGRLLVWIAALSAGLVGFAVIMLGPDASSFESAIRDWFRSVLEVHKGVRAQLEQSSSADIDRAIEFMVWVLPLASATLWMLTTIMNVWLASMIVERSGVAIRPRMQYSHLDLPPKAVIAFAVAIVASLLPGTIGIVASSLAAVLAVSFILQGLAVIHVISPANQYRPAILGATYALLILGSWIGAGVILIIGFLEAMVRLRDRFADRGGHLTSNRST